MRILFLTNLLPYPLDNGGKIKTFTTLKALSDSGHDIDLLCFKETVGLERKKEEDLLKICKSVSQIYALLTTANHKKYMISIAIKSFFSPLPFVVYKYKSNEMRTKINEKKDVKYDIVYFDHLPMCVYLDYTRRLWPKAKIILDEHNCETVITKRKAEESRNILKKSFLYIETIKLKKFEVSSIKKVNDTVVLSSTDYNALNKLTKNNFSHFIIPIGIPDKGLKQNVESSILNILFIGTLTWEPNNAGLIWFLREVMPIVEHRGINFHLYIVGRNPSKEVRALCEIYKEKITITGYVDSVDKYYDICDVTIVPLFIGSGQRVKLIEAFSKGLPAISTTIGAEGLEYNNESIVLANNKIEFANAIELMQEKEIRKRIGSNSRKIYEKYYSEEKYSEKIKQLAE